jgi:predicted O-methyltransferase YrrM
MAQSADSRPVARFSPRWWLKLPETAKNVYRRLKPPDVQLQEMQYWWHGALERRAIEHVLADAAGSTFQILNPGLREPGTSITIFELACVLMAMRSVKARKVLEIGTFNGNTALNIAANLEDDGVLVTVDLPIEPPEKLALGLEQDRERNVTDRNAVGIQFRDRPEAKRIRQVLGDSAKLDFGTLGGPFDLAFIDGCHAYNYVKSDTEKVLEVMRPGGLVLWHDYSMIESVARAVDEYRGRVDRLVAIEGTRIALGYVRAR